MNRLKGKLVELECDKKQLAVNIGMDPSTFHRKLNKGTFSIREVRKIVEALNLNAREILYIFFEMDVA